MNYKEITEIIATKVMGWKLVERFDDKLSMAFWDIGAMSIETRSYNPLLDDNDCMEAWDKFSEVQNTTLEARGDDLGWEAILFDGYGHEKTSAHSIDRRRAMCECMAKAVTE